MMSVFVLEHRKLGARSPGSQELRDTVSMKASQGQGKGLRDFPSKPYRDYDILKHCASTTIDVSKTMDSDVGSLFNLGRAPATHRSERLGTA
jgi:hypothetical protein